MPLYDFFRDFPHPAKITNRRFAVRFAPSPSGSLHLGNARTALFNWLAARHFGGAFYLRIEDTDAKRRGYEAVGSIAKDLNWLGLGSHKTVIQSHRTDFYERVLQRLLRKNLAYPCFCTPSELLAKNKRRLAAGKPPRYSGKCAALSPAQTAVLRKTKEFVYRFRMPTATIEFDDLVRGALSFDGGDIGDFIIRRANGDFSFLFTNTMDDGAAKISHVLRGEDHISNTPRQLALLAALNVKPPTYGHLSLMGGKDGAVLSKRDGAQTVQGLRNQGFLAPAVINYLARVGHTFADDKMMSLDELAAQFSFSSLIKSSAKFDESQLIRRQKEAMADLTLGEKAEWCKMDKTHNSYFCEQFLTVVGDNIVLRKDARDWMEAVVGGGAMNAEAARVIAETEESFFFAAMEALQSGIEKKLRANIKTALAAAELRESEEEKMSDEELDLYLKSDERKKAVAENAIKMEKLAAEVMHWDTLCARVGEATGKKGRALFLPLRAALTGRTDGPPMDKLFSLIGAVTAEDRILAVIKNRDD